MTEGYKCPRCRAPRKSERTAQSENKKCVVIDYECNAQITMERNGASWTKKQTVKCVR